MFSKEGLAREQKIDPREAAKNNTRDWLGQCLINLNTQIESFDADLEKLTAGKGMYVRGRRIVGTLDLLHMEVRLICLEFGEYQN